MKGHGMLLGLLLIAAACDGEKSVASKSAAAYREAQAKGIPVGGGHEHGGHAGTPTAAGMDHSAHGATSTGGVAMDHSAHGTGAVDHAAMGHSAAAAGAMDHSAHGTGAADHAAMGHSAAAAGAMDHSAHTATGAVDHAAMGHGTTPDAHRGHTPAADAHAGHGAPAAPTAGHEAHTAATTPAAPHDQHAGMQHGAQPPAADPHAQHRAAATPGAAVVAAAPRSNAEMQRVQPSATLRGDAFDAPAAVAVSEAARAAQGGGHEGHQMRGITPGQDRENPPTPMPATRDGSTPAAPADHSGHGGDVKKNG